MICDHCGEDHPIEEIELAFRRPDVAAALSQEERERRVDENADLCVLDGDRFFVRAVLPLPLDGGSSVYNIGLWVEVEQGSFEKIYALWDDDAQAEQAPFQAWIANQVPHQQPTTIGLEGRLQLTGSTTRPKVLVAESTHPLYQEQVNGISTHRAFQYTSLVSKRVV